MESSTASLADSIPPYSLLYGGYRQKRYAEASPIPKANILYSVVYLKWIIRFSNKIKLTIVDKDMRLTITDKDTNALQDDGRIMLIIELPDEAF